MRLMLFIYVFIKLLIVVHAAKILVAQLVSTKSYANIMSSVLQNLAPNHEITYYSITDNTFDHPNVTVIKIPQSGRFHMEYANIFDKMLKNGDTSTDAENTVLGITPEFVERHFNSNIFQDLIHLKPKYDVLIMFSMLTEFFIQFAYHLNVPLIQIAASSPCPWQNEAIGNPNFPSYDSTLFTTELSDSFFNRLKKYIKHVQLLIRYNWYFLPSINEVTKKYFPEDTPSIETISKNTSLLFVNTIEAMGYSRPTLSNYVEIGGLHCKPANPLPKDLEQFIQGAGENGVIYFSLGATFRAQLPDNILKAFINVFSKLPQRIIWKGFADLEGLPENIKTQQWCPQQDILGHNKTKVFITQGGMLSLQEAVYNGVPVLVIPITLDQPINAKIAEKMGYGRYFPLNKFSEDALFAEIQEMLTNPKYKNKVEEISTLMKDVPETPAEKLKWWVDYIIKHKGFPMYRPNDDRYSWTKNVDIDIILFIQFCLLLIFVTIVVLSKLLTKQLNNNSVRIKNKTKTT